MHDIMISYSHKDRTYATMIVSILEQNGIKCWIDYRDALPGIEYAGSIVRAIKSSKAFVLLLSAYSNASAQVLNEINIAVNYGVTVIPFRIDETDLSDNMQYYLGKTHWLDAITPPMEAHIMELAEVIRRHTAPVTPTGEAPAEAAPKTPAPKPARTSSANGCRMLKFEELLDLGYTAATIAIQLVENDYVNFNGISEENEGTAEQWEEFLQNNSDTFCYLVNGENRIVGDWSIVALTDEAYETAMRGELLEAEIGLENTNMICFPNVYNGYILTMSLLPKYRSMQNYNLMMDSFLRQLEAYSENGIFFSRWCINVFSKDTEALVRQLGFKYVCDNKVLGKIYACTFRPLPDIPILKKYPRLCENYETM